MGSTIYFIYVEKINKQTNKTKNKQTKTKTKVHKHPNSRHHNPIFV